MSSASRSRRVLVVDDQIAPELAESLRRGGLDVAQADGIDSAIEAMEKELFDVIVLDMIMPNERGGPASEAGLIVLDWIRECRPDLPVLILTVLDASGVILPALELDAVGYLHKDAYLDYLLPMIDRVLAEQAERVSIASELFGQVRKQREIQRTAMPAMLGIGEFFTIAGCNLRLSVSSGDAFDFLRDGDRIAFLICDVTHHGIGPALVAARLCGAFRLLARLGHPLPEMDAYLHRTVVEMGVEELYAEGSVGILDLREQRIEFVRAAGRQPSLRSGSTCALVGDLSPATFAWGFEPTGGRSRATPESLPFRRGNSLVFYTDGLIDIGRRSNRPFETARIVEEHRVATARHARALCEEILYQAVAYGGGDPAHAHPGLVLALDDDTTVLALHWPE